MIILTGSSKQVRFLSFVEVIKDGSPYDAGQLVVRVIAQELLSVLFLPRITITEGTKPQIPN